MNADVQQFFDLEADVTDNDDSEGADDEAENEMMLRGFPFSSSYVIFVQS